MLSVCDNVTLNPSEKMSLIRQELVTLSRKELMRVAVMEAISGGTISNADATDSRGISMRQVIRLEEEIRRGRNRKGGQGRGSKKESGRSSHNAKTRLQSPVENIHGNQKKE